MQRNANLKRLRDKTVLGLLRGYWRLQRGMTLGAQAVLIDEQNRALLIRHTYCPGWFFPGGGVEPGETTEEAAIREAREEVGAIATEPPVLHGFFSNHMRVRRDHIAVYVMRHWTRNGDYRQPREIAETGLFGLDELPDDVDPGTRQRLREILEGLPAPSRWI